MSKEISEIQEVTQESAPRVYVKDGLKPFIEQVRNEVSGEVPDLSTKKGRDRLASLAMKVSRSKTAIEKPGRAYLKHLKEMPKVVETELREFVLEMDALRDETRKPLTDWENEEKARVAAIKERIDAMAPHEGYQDEHSSVIYTYIEGLSALVVDESFEEFEAEAHRAKSASLVLLEVAAKSQKEKEDQQAEIERLRKEAEQQAQREHEAQLIREAEERARKQAEQAAQAEREAAAKRESDAKAKADQERLRLMMEAEQAKKDAEQAAIDADNREKMAAENERKRQQEEIAEAKRLADKRAADRSHMAKIHNAAKQGFIDGGMTEELAVQAVKLIAKRKIPGVSIAY